jgi:thiol-disulfide isomerase/thioredoxin
VSGASIEVCHKNYNKPIVETREDFLKKWNGIYLIAEPNELSGEADYKVNKRRSLFSSLIPVAAFGGLFIVSLFLVKRTVDAAYAASLSAAAIYLQYFVLLSGVIVTSLLLWYEIDKNNPLLHKVCTGIAKGNCSAILTGSKSRIFKWLSWSEVGFFYFAGGLLVLLFSEHNINNAVSLLGLLNLLALPYIVFSVYYQWQIAGQWCVLCLLVQALLLLGGINIVANHFLVGLYNFPVSFLISALLIYLLPVLLWYALKPSVLGLQHAKHTKREYLRIKFNAPIFETLLKKQKAITVPVDGLGIDIGNSRATNMLIKVCNPYCGPCSKVHPKIEKLMEETPNLKEKIIFTTPNQPELPGFKPVSHLLAINEQSNEKNIQQALDDWYLPGKKDYTLFAEKHPMNGELTKQGNKIEAMEEWCKAMDVRVTPTLFINGYQLPDAYDIEDLEYFLLE